MVYEMKKVTGMPAAKVVGMAGVLDSGRMQLFLAQAEANKAFPIGAGIYLIEMSRSQDRNTAWSSTKAALRGVLHSMGIELAAGMAIFTTWVIAAVLTR